MNTISSPMVNSIGNL